MAPTKKQKYEFAAAVVDVAIVQAAECSGLRKWLIERAVAHFTGWHEPNADEMLLMHHEDLIDIFANLIPPNEMPKEPFSLSLFSEYPDPPMPWDLQRQSP